MEATRLIFLYKFLSNHNIICMKTQIILYKISYFIFCFLISCFIIFSINKGFNKKDIIIIPIFAILLFLIIDFSVNFRNHNLIENYIGMPGFKLIDERYEPQFLPAPTITGTFENKKIIVNVNTNNTGVTGPINHYEIRYRTQPNTETWKGFSTNLNPIILNDVINNITYEIQVRIYSGTYKILKNFIHYLICLYA